MNKCIISIKKNVVVSSYSTKNPIELFQFDNSSRPLSSAVDVSSAVGAGDPDGHYEAKLERFLKNPNFDISTSSMYAT